MNDWSPIQKAAGWRVPPKVGNEKDLATPHVQKMHMWGHVTIRVEPEDAPPRYARVIDDEGRLQFYDINP